MHCVSLEALIKHPNLVDLRTMFPAMNAKFQPLAFDPVFDDGVIIWTPNLIFCYYYKSGNLVSLQCSVMLNAELKCSYPRKLVVGCYLSVKVNSLTSIDTEMSFSYYSLPFCKPKEGVKDGAENLGELLMGDRIENSPYRFKMYTNETEIFLCQSNKLSADDFKLLKERNDEMYQVNLTLDNLTAIRYTKKEGFMLRWTEYPAGVNIQDAYYVFNHLKFKVLVHKYEETNVARMRGIGDAEVVVGFEVVPCSATHNGNLVKNLKCMKSTHLRFNATRLLYQRPSRKVSQLSSPMRCLFEDGRIQSPLVLSILNSLMVITFLAGIVLVIFLRTVRRDLTRYEELDKEAQAQMTEVLSGWKLVVGDVFRAPSNPALLCIMVGDGVQILGMAVVTILFAAVGFMSPASRGTLITAGYVSVRLWRTIGCGDHRGWASVAWKAACFFPGIAFLILTTLNFLLRGSHSTGAIPSTHLIGGYFGAKAPHIEYPVRTNQIPREIPVQNYPSRLLVLGAGTCMHLFAIYIFLYSINYLVFDLKSLSGPVFSTLYLGYSLFMVLAIMFATGTVGFLSSFWFVDYLFSSVKLD
ncbi:hypothetical protein ES288_D05G013100v1 [Gossypium darwinii]|uniref:Transmembrane 9 superfamily member n=1 Tax=Gossypium darwinii TaxID=34276 RepID=A0A5D2CB82_GOSDA|nr:hypothetical protein ES288_D05G013100v1 [Gossypium darwinii]